MKIWYFSEQPYYPAWDKVAGPVRIEPPSRLVDPKVAHNLLNGYIDEWMLADQLGFNVMVNEHHSTFTCMSVSCMMTLAILARQTKNARLLALGIPVANRNDPFRIAEEIAYADTMSGGRMEIGLVKGTDYELSISNNNPARMMDRYWEAHDIVKAALTSLDGPFSWEGEYFHYRNVNVIPRCYQQPHPPFWIPCHSGSSAREAARRGYTMATFLSGPGAKPTIEAYRDEYLKTFKRSAPLDRLAYLGLFALARDEKTAKDRARRSALWLATEGRTPDGVRLPSGYVSSLDKARVLKDPESAKRFRELLPNGRMVSNPPTADELIEVGMMFSGTPDQVFDQLKTFIGKIGPFGNLITQTGGALESSENMDSMRLFATEVWPRLQELEELKESPVEAA